jgi:hypothetical protein
MGFVTLSRSLTMSFVPSLFDSRVIALDMGGNQIWASDSLDGIPQGDPLISSDGGYVFLTHNEFDSEAGISTGHFTILEGNTTGMVFYTDATDDDRAFGPPGIFHSPVEGNYDPIVSGSPVSEGENNSNDFIMWSQTPKPSDTAISNGFMYGFQFPRTFDGSNSTGIGFFELGELEVDFQSTTPPVITNEGLSAYWGVTRSSYRGWNNKRFSRARDNAVGFERNVDFAGEAVFAAPALSNDGPDPIIFGGSASTEFVRMTIDFETVIVRTQDLIMSKAIVDGEERAVYYVEMNGNLHQANVDTLVDNWNFTVNFAVEGEMALTPNNDVLIVADRRGVIRALEVAEIAVTEAPSDMPSDMPSMAPSGESVPTAPVAPTAPAPTADVDATPAPVSSGDTDAPVTGTAPPASGANQPMMVIAAVAGFAGLFI